MWVDIWSIVWRDLRLYRAQFDEPKRLAMGIAASFLFLVGIEIAFEIHNQIATAHPLLLIWIWCWLPLGSAVTLSTDAVAGERERHTLESLLATRIPARAILVGKTLAITFQSWFSALLVALGALVTLNLVTIWSGELVVYPISVMIIGPVLSLLLTLLGTIVAMLFSMDAPTVRQANFRILMVTSLLPILMIVPVVALLVMGTIALGIAVEFTGAQVPNDPSFRSSGLVALGLTTAVAGLIASIIGASLVTGMRFTRERLLRVSAAPPSASTDTAPPERVAAPAALSTDGRSPLARPEQLSLAVGEPAWKTIIRDARVVAWKELVEAKGLVREWRGWLVLVCLVVASMVVQMSAIMSWYWAQDADTSLVFWLAMATAIPIFIAQRSADAIAGERERHTGEILFTTRLSHTGILLGKLSVVALLPWAITLAIPATGLIATNLIHADAGPFFYPPEVLVAGSGLTLGVAVLFSAGGLLASLNAPTVQHAARRISWFLMPILIAPGLILRNTAWSGGLDQAGEFSSSGTLGIVASGDLATYILITLPLIALLAGMLVLALVNRFKRGTTVFD